MYFVVPCPTGNLKIFQMANKNLSLSSSTYYVYLTDIVHQVRVKPLPTRKNIFARGPSKMCPSRNSLIYFLLSISIFVSLKISQDKVSKNRQLLPAHHQQQHDRDNKWLCFDIMVLLNSQTTAIHLALLDENPKWTVERRHGRRKTRKPQKNIMWTPNFLLNWI